MTIEIGILFTFTLYFLVVLGIGYYFYHKIHSVEDYIIGGRELNPYVGAMSAQASDMSGWLLLGLPGSIYVAGLGGVWIGISLAVGSYLAWLLVAKRLRIYSEKYGNALTIPEFFSNRFKDESGCIRFVSSAVILVFFTFYVTSGFVSGGNILISVLGLGAEQYKIAVFITAAIIISYTFLGGFKAICWADLVQAILMIFAIIIVPLAALGQIDGGWGHMINIVNNEVNHFTDITWNNGSPITITILLSSLAWGLGYFGMPHIIIKYMAIRDPEKIKVARRVGTIWVVIALTGATLIGIVGRAYIPGLPNPERAFIEIVGSGIFTTAICGILYAALMASVMSTADSQLLVASSSVTNDLCHRYTKNKKQNIDEKKLIWISRAVVIVIAIVAMIFALDENSSIMNLVSFAWSGFGAAFGPIIILALFWKHINAKGAIAGMLTGFITDVIWNSFFNGIGIIPGLLNQDWCIWNSGLYELLPAFILTFIVAIIVSLLTTNSDKDVQKEFDKIIAEKF